MNPSSFDYVVVGAGTAGCVVASRLSEDPSIRVLLVEAGQAQGPPALAAGPFPVRGTAVDWGRTTVAQPGTAGIEQYFPLGKMLGGSSAVNGMIHIRGHRANYDAWAAGGAAGWDYESLLPYFKRSETAPGRDPRYRGTDGPMIVAPQPGHSQLLEDAFAAAVAAGNRANADISGGDQDGVGWHDMNIVDGRRQTAADAYLRPHLGRPNLTVTTDALVRRLVVDKGRCRGIEYTVDGQLRQADARREVVLCAGAIGSPHLLLVSGIGPASLRDLGIDVVAERPGVGKNLHDQPMSSVVYAPSEEALPLVRIPRLTHFTIRLRTDPALAEPDVQIVVLDKPYHSRAMPAPADAFTIAFSAVTPVSRGTVRITDADIETPPLIDPRYLDDERDLVCLLKGLRAARALGESAELARWRGSEALPGALIQTEEACIDYLRRSTASYYHPVGTCRIGVDEHAVVDSSLRVHGVEGLRVADASVMPTVVSSNTNATVLAIGERAAELIGAAHSV